VHGRRHLSSANDSLPNPVAGRYVVRILPQDEQEKIFMDPFLSGGKKGDPQNKHKSFQENNLGIKCDFLTRMV
jgi:hypothetical protein